jgi:hypothetical protein
MGKNTNKPVDVRDLVPGAIEEIKRRAKKHKEKKQ